MKPWEIDEMTWDSAGRLFRYARENPPAHVILGAVHLKRETKYRPRDRKGPMPQPVDDVPNGASEAELLAAGIMTVKRRQQP